MEGPLLMEMRETQRELATANERLGRAAGVLTDRALGEAEVETGIEIEE